MESWSTVFSLAFSLFLLMDPVGNVPLFVALLKDLSARRQRIIILREMLIALFVITLFNFIGEFLLNLLKVKMYTVLLSGGIILFLIAIHMIFPQQEKNGMNYGKEPLVVPLAIPLVAGPAVLAAVTLYSYRYDTATTVSGILIAWLFSTIILLSASFLKRTLGQRGIVACEKLMGLLLTLISVQLFMEGITAYLATQ